MLMIFLFWRKCSLLFLKWKFCSSLSRCLVLVMMLKCWFLDN